MSTTHQTGAWSTNVVRAWCLVGVCSVSLLELLSASAALHPHVHTYSYPSRHPVVGADLKARSTILSTAVWVSGVEWHSTSVVWVEWANIRSWSLTNDKSIALGHLNRIHTDMAGNPWECDSLAGQGCDHTESERHCGSWRSGR